MDSLEARTKVERQAADEKFDALTALDSFPGFTNLPEHERQRFQEVVRVCGRGRLIIGGWRAVADALGLRQRQTYEQLARWRAAGLISESTGSELVYDERGKRTFASGVWTILPANVSSERSKRMREVSLSKPSAHGTAHDARACASSAAHDVLAVASSSLHEGKSSSSRAVARADQSIEALSERLGGTPITGRGRQILHAALIENDAGVHRVWDTKAMHGKNPIGLLVHLLESGEHRATEPAICTACYRRDPTVRDYAPDLRAVGVNIGDAEIPRCESCAKSFAHYFNDHKPADTSSAGHTGGKDV